MRLVHFYHVFAAGSWEAPVVEHLDALEESGFDGPLYVGLVGSPDQRAAVCDYLTYRLRRSYVTIDADFGFEQVTLHVLWRYAQDHHGAAMYAHTKGSWHSCPEQDDWRRAMTRKVIAAWRDHLDALDSVDASGFSWVPQGYFFAGNYWLARCSYLRTLPEPALGKRDQAERWIGWQEPCVANVTDPSVALIWEDGDTHEVGEVPR